ncbi:chaperonin 10-like protein [Mycena vitilis]|nr:chaperonin 10-like protein [Mycena vitilis]
MFAAVYQPGNDNLVLDKKYPIRELQDGEVLLRITAAGVCHTDAAVLNGVALDTRKSRLGPKVDASDVEIGKLYSVLIFDGCVKGLTAQPGTIPPVIGVGKDGAFAQYMITDAAALVPPDGVPAEVAAIASDAGVTAYNAVQNAAKVKKGDKVLIFGIGGLGHMAVQYAKYFGATGKTSFAILSFPTSIGFGIYACCTKTAGGFTVDTTIDFIANTQTFNLAMAALRGNESVFTSNPKLVLVGYSADNLVFNTADAISFGVQKYVSQETACSYNKQGTVQAHHHVTTERLEDANKAIDELRSFEIVGKKVLIPPAIVQSES